MRIIEFTAENRFVTTPSNNHFNCYINKLNLNKPPNQLNNRTNYYYDAFIFDCKNQLYKDKKDLFVDNENPIIPYICIYEKDN